MSQRTNEQANQLELAEVSAFGILVLGTALSGTLRHTHFEYEFCPFASVQDPYLFEEYPFLAEQKPLPVFDACDSNPICVFLDGPLRGIVAHIFHDGENALRFLDFAEFISALANSSDVLTAYETYDSDTLPPKVETHDIQQRLTNLMAIRDTDDDSESYLMRFAMDLCPDTSPEIIDQILQEEDEYVRDKALNRLQKVGAKESLYFIEEDQKSFERFVSNVKQRMPNTDVRGLNLAMLYAIRNDEDFDEEIEALKNRLA